MRKSHPRNPNYHDDSHDNGSKHQPPRRITDGKLINQEVRTAHIVWVIEDVILCGLNRCPRVLSRNDCPGLRIAYKHEVCIRRGEQRIGNVTQIGGVLRHLVDDSDTHRPHPRRIGMSDNIAQPSNELVALDGLLPHKYPVIGELSGHCCNIYIGWNHTTGPLCSSLRTIVGDITEKKCFNPHKSHKTGVLCLGVVTLWSNYHG